MRRSPLCALVLTLAAGTAWGYSAVEYRALFAPEYAAAEEMAVDVYARLLSRLGDEELARIGTAIVFPELSRYSYIRDVAETSALELSYVLGTGADFSIGKLQMKPSFAEAVERLAGDALLSRFPRVVPTGADEKTRRGLRIQRLKSDEGEADYLTVFLLLMLRRFPDMAGTGPAAVRLFATAYNSGPERPREELDALASTCFFPYGKSYQGEQFCYVDIALQYYDQEPR